MHEFATYESTRAQRSTESLPDKILWDGNASFRDQPYRQLHHQQGLIGLFRVRLLEAADLKRSYWSALALGPVKHLGLSKAHGEVSSSCTFSLAFEDSHHQNDVARRMGNPGLGEWDKKPAAKRSSKDFEKKQPAVVSPVIPGNNNPVWDNCKFEFPLLKGSFGDGNKILLQVQVDEDATAVENIIPGIPSGGSRKLGVGRLDITDLCLGQSPDGHVLPGVRDSWISVSLNDDKKGQQQQQAEGENNQLGFSAGDPLAPPAKKPEKSSRGDTTGKVRVLVSYEPVGLEPQPRDIVALEAFARRNPSAASCRPLLQPLLPLTVIDRRGSYLLCEYSLTETRWQKKACVRLHRSAVFVIERQNLVDAAQNLALLPVDVVMSTPLGRATAQALGPAATAGKELLMPAVLSAKLLWMAGRTTTLAGLSGVQALSSTLWQEGSNSLTASHRKQNNHATARQDGLAPFVQL